MMLKEQLFLWNEYVRIDILIYAVEGLASVDTNL